MQDGSWSCFRQAIVSKCLLLKAHWQDIDFVGDGATFFKNSYQEIISVSQIWWKNQNKWFYHKIIAEFLIAELQRALQTHFQKLVSFTVLSKLRTWIKSKLLTNIHQSLITTHWMLQLLQEIYVAFEEYRNPLKTHYKTNKQKRATQLSCWLYFMWQYWSRLPTPLFGNQDLLFNFRTIDFSGVSAGLSLPRSTDF